MGCMWSNIDSNYFDLTLDMGQYPFYDGTSTMVLMLRSDVSAPYYWFPNAAYTVQVSNQVGSFYNTIVWGDWFSIRKQISYPVPDSGKWRFVLDEHLLSVYLNDVFIDDYDYSVGFTINGTGKWGLLNYGSFSQTFNGYTLKTDRRDNAF